MSRDCCVALPHSDTGLSAICDCGISGSYYLTILGIKHQHDPIILDFSKAFDSVPHQRLMRDLDHYGIRGSTYNWIQAILIDRTQQVLVEGATSPPENRMLPKYNSTIP